MVGVPLLVPGPLGRLHDREPGIGKPGSDQPHARVMIVVAVGPVPDDLAPPPPEDPGCGPPGCRHAPDPRGQAPPSGTASPPAQGPAEALQDRWPILGGTNSVWIRGDEWSVCSPASTTLRRPGHTWQGRRPLRRPPAGLRRACRPLGPAGRARHPDARRARIRELIQSSTVVLLASLTSLYQTGQDGEQTTTSSGAAHCVPRSATAGSISASLTPKDIPRPCLNNKQN
jgi:hypothetical protein